MPWRAGAAVHAGSRQPLVVLLGAGVFVIALAGCRPAPPAADSVAPARAAAKPATLGVADPLTGWTVDFERPPGLDGWRFERDRRDKLADPWTTRRALSGTHALAAALETYWETPRLRVSPLAYYRVDFASITSQRCYLGAYFYDEAGIKLWADYFTSIDRSETWKTNSLCIRAVGQARTMTLMFQPIVLTDHGARNELLVDDVHIEAVDAPAVAAWADAVYAELPPVDYAPPTNRWQFLPQTKARLRAGGDLTIVVVGDSIANDMGNSAIDALLEDRYPGLRVRLVTATRRNTGAGFFAQEPHLQEQVCRYRPDLIVLGGISNRGSGGLAFLIEAVRRECAAEILVVSGAFGPRFRARDGSLIPWREGATDHWHDWLAAFAASEQAAFLDLYAVVSRYLTECGRPYTSFNRDEVHPNRFGKQVMGRVLLRFLELDEG